jgi:hypothetical protein
MNCRFNWTVALLVCTAIIGFTSNVQAQCDAGCGDGFGYPGFGGSSASGCSAGGGAGCGVGSSLRERADHLAEIHRRDFARNQAWPKPFDCADRQLYFAMWDPMFEQGIRCNCLFTSVHFDPNTNELNQTGRSKVQAIFQNNPIGQKIALLQNAGNSRDVQARLQNLQNTIDTWYGQNAFMEVALSDYSPTIFTGSRSQLLNELRAKQTAAPIIPVASGTGTTSDVASGQ